MIIFENKIYYCSYEHVKENRPIRFNTLTFPIEKYSKNVNFALIESSITYDNDRLHQWNLFQC